VTNRTDLASPCRFLEWDSDFFRARIASVSSIPLDASGFEEVLTWCRSQRIDCLYLLTDVGDTSTRRLAEDRRFRLVDVRMTFGLITSEGEPPVGSPEPGSVRLARDADVPELRALAAESHTQTRFWSDERFDRAACAQLYATWIEKSVRGHADAVWVVEHEGRVAGYLSCHRREGELGEIGLVAVASSARGRGLGHALVERGTSWFREQGCRRITVVTQGSSLAAQRLYQTHGFRTSAVELWHHRWFDSAEQGRT
jgi:N-acetylglutamate synthase-like GNAT family acetyltransferase